MFLPQQMKFKHTFDTNQDLRLTELSAVSVQIMLLLDQGFPIWFYKLLLFY